VIGPKIKMSLQQYTDVADGALGFTRTWATVRSIRGALLSMSGTRMERYGRLYPDVTHVFWCDYQKDITVTERDRFTYGTRIFNVLSMDDVAEKGQFLRFILKEVK